MFYEDIFEAIFKFMAYNFRETVISQYLSRNSTPFVEPINFIPIFMTMNLEVLVYAVIYLTKVNRRFYYMTCNMNTPNWAFLNTV